MPRSATAAPVKPPKPNTRAVLRMIEPGGEWSICPQCDQPVKFRATRRLRKVLCNVYGGRPRRWLRVEHYHEACYTEAGEPHGPADASKVRRHG